MVRYATVDVVFGADSGFCFKVLRKTEDGEGWQLQALKSDGGTISRGAFGLDRSGKTHKFATLELAQDRAKKRFELDLMVSDYLVCDELKVKYVETTAECYIVGGKGVKKSYAPLREYIPDQAHSKLPDELFWTEIEEAHGAVLALWAQGKYVDAVDAMSTLCDTALALIVELPKDVGGSNQYFSQSVHITYDFITNKAKVLEVKPAWDKTRLQNHPYTLAGMPPAQRRLKAKAKALAVEVDKRLTSKTRNNLFFGSKDFGRYLPSMNAKNARPALLAEVEEMGRCQAAGCAHPEKEQVVLKANKTCKKCMAKTSAGTGWSSDEEGGEWAAPAQPAPQPRAQSKGGKGHGKGKKGGKKGERPASPPAGVQKPPPPPAPPVAAPQAAPKAALTQDVFSMAPRDRLRWSEAHLAAYGADRHNFRQWEEAIQQDLQTFQETGRAEDARVLTEALWVVRDFQNNEAEYGAAPPPPPGRAEETVEDVLAGLGQFAVKKKGRKKRTPDDRAASPAQATTHPLAAASPTMETMFSPAAFGKAYLHAFAHPSQAVSGFLIGTRTSASGKALLFVDDALPLSHNDMQLAPMLKVGLELAVASAEHKGLSVVGYYSAPAALGDRPVVTSHAEKVIRMIAEKTKSDPIAVVLLNEKITGTVDEVPFKLFGQGDLRSGRLAADGGYTSGYMFEGKVPTALPDPQAAQERVRQLLKEGAAVVDLEDHMEAPEKDYENPDLTKRLSANIVPQFVD